MCCAAYFEMVKMFFMLNNGAENKQIPKQFAGTTYVWSLT